MYQFISISGHSNRKHHKHIVTSENNLMVYPLCAVLKKFTLKVLNINDIALNGHTVFVL